MLTLNELFKVLSEKAIFFFFPSRNILLLRKLQNFFVSSILAISNFKHSRHFKL